MPTLGRAVDNDREIELKPDARKQGTYVVGITGTGKTTLLLNIALQDIFAGDGVCVMDPHGDLTEDLLLRIPKERADDVILLDPADIDHPFALNLFECPDREDPRLVDRVCSEIVTTFHKLFYYSWGPHLEDLLRHSTLTLLANAESTLLDMLILLTQEDRREEMAARVADPIIQTYWRDRFPKKAKDQPEWAASTLNKIGRFLSNPLVRNIVSQPRSTFDLRQIMDQGKILLVNLSKGKIGEDNSALLGSVLVGKILIAALSRAETPPEGRRPFHLIVDEYQSFATESFPTLQSEARKFKIETIVAHQYRQQLDDLNRGSTLNVGNLIVFRVTGDDSRELAAQFDNTPPEPTIVGRQEKLGIPLDPLSHLEHHAAPNHEIYRAYRALRGWLDSRENHLHAYLVLPFERQITDLTERINERINQAGVGWPHLGSEELVRELRTARQESRTRKQEAEEKVQKEAASLREYTVRQYLYDRMQEPGDNERLDHRLDRVVRSPGIHSAYTEAEISAYYTELEGAERQQEVRKLVDEKNQELVTLLKHLGDLLAETPIRAGTTEYEPVYDKPRLYSDVQAEMANRLTNLPNFQARCSLVEEDGLAEYQIQTEPPKGDPDPDVAAYIRERSRKMALPRNQIEEAIRERMAKGVPPISFYE